MMMRPRCVLIVIALAIFCPATRVLAQEELSSDQLRRMYVDALTQLKTAQDRRNDLARENQKLRDRISLLEKALDKSETEAISIADKTFQARSQASLFQEFLKSNPYIRLQWQSFVEKNLLTAPDTKALLDPDWPLPHNP